MVEPVELDVDLVGGLVAVDLEDCGGPEGDFGKSWRDTMMVSWSEGWWSWISRTVAV